MITITTTTMVTMVTATAIRYGQCQQGFRVLFSNPFLEYFLPLEAHRQCFQQMRPIALLKTLRVLVRTWPGCIILALLVLYIDILFYTFCNTHKVHPRRST
jgi:hypothetical protein